MSKACSSNGEKRIVFRILLGGRKEKDNYVDQNAGGWIVIKVILEKKNLHRTRDSTARYKISDTSVSSDGVNNMQMELNFIYYIRMFNLERSTQRIRWHRIIITDTCNLGTHLMMAHRGRNMLWNVYMKYNSCEAGNEHILFKSFYYWTIKGNWWLQNKETNKQTPFSESTSELYRPSDHWLTVINILFGLICLINFQNYFTLH
jgi:hypothetical protein